MNVAMALTSLRVALAPVFAFVFFLDGWTGLALALAVAAVSELTDAFDGMAARRLHQVTELGKILDPMADSVSRLTAFICLASVGVAPVFLVLLMFYRDALVATIRAGWGERSQIVEARLSGKIKAVAQAIAILGILVARAAAGPAHANDRTTVVWALMIGATLVTVWSGIDYLMAAMRLKGAGPRV